MFLNKSLIGMVAVGTTLTASVYATDYSESFESGTVGASLELNDWTGYGTYETTEGQNLAAGTPLGGAHTKHVAVDGSVEATFPATNGDAQLDMLVRVAVPDEALSTMTDATAKFAIAIDRASETTGTLKYWNATSSAWVSLGDTVYTEGQWIRVLVLLSANNGRCKVSVDGNACVTANGYKAATGADTNGAWYPVIQTANLLASMKVVGTTALDDIKLTHGTSASFAPTYEDASGQPVTVVQNETTIPMSWFDENSIPTNVTAATDGSGMSIADKYVTGLDPNNGDKFELKNMAMNKESGTVKANLTLPACNPPSGGTLKIQTSSGDGSWSDAATVSAGATSAEIPLGSGNVTYFRMVLDN